jgi:hypothetical protein
MAYHSADIFVLVVDNHVDTLRRYGLVQVVKKIQARDAGSKHAYAKLATSAIEVVRDFYFWRLC